MSAPEDPVSPLPEGERAGAPVPAAPPAAATVLEGGLERIARELLRQQRTERRWRV